MRFLRTLLTLALLSATAFAADYLAYVGTYTSSSSKGIYVYRFQASTGKLTSLGVAAETPNPSFLVAHPNHRFLYAANESGGQGAPGDTVSAFSIDPKTGKLAFLNKVSSHGAGPCHIALDRTGRWLAVANYNSGSVAVFPVKPDGTLGEAVAVDQHRGAGVNPQRQKGPHAHCVVFSPDNRFLFTADLGLDKIVVYRFDAAKGSIVPNDPWFAPVAPGAGVRHLAFHPNGKVLYAITEMGSTVIAFAYDAEKGTLTEFQTVSTLPHGFTGASSTAEIAVNPEGTVLYGSNRGNDSLALFAINPDNFTLAQPEFAPTLGKTPRHFTLDPTGRFLMVENQDSNNIVVFHVHERTGQLTPARLPVEVSMPVCLVFVPVG